MSSTPTYAVVGDYKYTVADCNPIANPGCNLISTASCPRIGNAVSATAVRSAMPNIVCTYDGTQIASSEQRVNDWLTRFGALNNPSETTLQGFNTLMPLYCGQNSRDKNFACSGGMAQCSRVFQPPPPDAAAHPCATWYQGLRTSAETNSGSKAQLDSFISTYCNNFPDSDDCKCANGIKDPNYATLAQSSNSLAGCWYAPCTGVAASSQLQPTSVVPSLFGNSPCPTDVCNTILNIANSNPTIQNSDIAQNIQCNETTVQGGGTFTPPAATPSPSAAQNLLTKYWWAFLLGFVLLAALAVGGALFSSRNKPKQVTKITATTIPVPPPL